MNDNDNSHLPPLPELLKQVGFDVYGLAAPYEDLQLRSLYYGYDETEKQIVGLSLFYIQHNQAEPKILAVESSLIPENIPPDDPKAQVKWSGPNLQALRAGVHRLQGRESIGLGEEEALDRQYKEEMKELGALSWSSPDARASKSVQLGMAYTRDEDGMILGRRFQGAHMLLLAAHDFRLDQLEEVLNSLIPIQGSREIAERHQNEFENLSLEG